MNIIDKAKEIFPGSKEEKKGDPRIQEFLLWWSDEHKRQHGVGYKLEWGKHSKWAKELLTWSDKEFDSGLQGLQDAAMNFLKEKDGFFKDHNLARFYKEPHRWVKAVKKAVISPKLREIEPAPRSSEEIFESFKEWAINSPETAVKGFSLTYGLMKGKNPKLYQDCRDFLLGLVGKARAKEIFNAMQKEGMVKAI